MFIHQPWGVVILIRNHLKVARTLENIEYEALALFISNTMGQFPAFILSLPMRGKLFYTICICEGPVFGRTPSYRWHYNSLSS